MLEKCVSTEQEDWAAQAEENHWSSHPLMSHSCLAVLYLYMTASSCLWTIYLGCFCFVFSLKDKCANVNHLCHTHIHAWRAPHGDGGVKPLLNATGSQQLVLFFTINLQWRYFIVGWFCCFEGTVTGQWLCVFVDSCCVGQWTCWIYKWMLVSYHKSNGKRIKWEK